MGAIKLFTNSINPNRKSTRNNVKSQDVGIDLKKTQNHYFNINEYYDKNVIISEVLPFNINLNKTQDHYFNIDDCCEKIIRVASVFPFRIRFKSVDIAGYSSQNPAPIGIAIIGYSNYIL